MLPAWADPLPPASGAAQAPPERHHSPAHPPKAIPRAVEPINEALRTALAPIAAHRSQDWPTGNPVWGNDTLFQI